MKFHFCPSVASVVSVMLFKPCYKVLSGYFYVSLNLTGILTHFPPSMGEQCSRHSVTRLLVSLPNDLFGTREKKI